MFLKVFGFHSLGKVTYIHFVYLTERTVCTLGFGISIYGIYLSKLIGNSAIVQNDVRYVY